MENNIKLGDRVFWTSQAGGRWTTKFGTIIYLGKPGVRIDTMLADHQGWLDAPSRLQVEHATNNQKEFSGWLKKGILVAVDKRTRSNGEVEKFNKLRYYSPTSKLEVST